MKYMRLVTITLGLALFCAGCSSAPPQRVDAEGLRSRADQAFERPELTPRPQAAHRAGPENQVSPSSPSLSTAPTKAECESLSCLNPDDVFAAEGLGATVRAGQEDATARLSARIESEVESVVRSSYSESDSGSQSQSSIERSVKTRFKYGELIRHLPAQGEAPQLKVVAYFLKSEYQARLKRDYGSALEDVRFQLKDAVAPDASPSLFVQAWRASQEPLGQFKRYAQLYQAVMGSQSKEIEEVNKLIESADRQRRRMLSRAQLVITYQGSASAELKGAISSLLQSTMSAWQLRSRVGDDCPKGGYQLLVDTSTSISTHIATGTPMSRLKWSISTRTCPEQTVISHAQLPALSGVERANKSSEAALVAEVDRVKGFLTTGKQARNRQLKAKLSDLSSALHQVLSESFPISAQLKGP